MTMEDILINRIKGGTLAIKLGNKTPQEANVGFLLYRLKEINRPMYDELMNNYKFVVNELGK